MFDLLEILSSRAAGYKKISLLIFALLCYAMVSAQYTDTAKNTLADTVSATVDTTSSLQKDTLVFDNLSSKNKVKTKYTIAGIVKDKNTGEIVPFATVFFPHSPVGAPGDADGRFLLQFDKFPNDTIKVQVLGYAEYYKVINQTLDSQYVEVLLSSSATQLGEVVIKPGEDPILALLKKVIAKKPVNNPQRFENYSYEAYNKVQLDVLNLTKEEFLKLPIPYLKHFSFIYNNVDSSSGEYVLPFYLTETISDYYYQSSPRKTKEFIKGSQIKGINNMTFERTMTRYLGSMFLNLNPYDNYVNLFDKKYVSPINNAAWTFYNYTIIDTQVVDGFDVITLHFEPKRPGENCFEGLISIVDSVFALQYITAEIPKEANLNFIKKARFYKTYAPLGDSIWFCTKENTTAELQVLADLPYIPAFRAIKTNSYSNIRINDDTIAQVVNSPQFKLDVVISDSARYRTDEYWREIRHEALNKSEKAIYTAFDSLQNSPAYTKFKNMLRFVASGVLRFGPIEYGPYWNIYSYNDIEGDRFQLSLGTTPNLSKNVYINGYLAYGTKDERFKYRLEALWLLNKEYPRSYFFATYTHDVDRTVNYYDYVNFNNFLAIRKPDIPLKFMFTDNARVEYMKEYPSGFSHMLTVLHKRYDPYPPLPEVNVFNDFAGNATGLLIQTEANILLRYAWKEQFFNGNYYRLSLGSKYPIVELRYGVGLKGVFEGAYDYHRVTLNVYDKIRVPPVGHLFMNVFCGKYWGVLPYPLLQVHPGNESYIYNKLAFSMMNQYEFLSDQYVGVMLEHSLGGGLFNYIPLLKKIKLRQFWTAKGVIGSLNDSNRALNFNKGFTFRTLESSPYVEVGTGIENILRLFRVDFVWRVTPKRLPDEAYERYFGVFGSLKVTF